MKKPLASLSLDLDNLWSYQRTHGDAGWESFPSYFDVLIPRVLNILAEERLTITWFVVGKDADIPANVPYLKMLADAGHEIGNHSYMHEPWLHLYSKQQIVEEFRKTEVVLQAATGRTPKVFRGPGFSFSGDVLRVLMERGYTADCSTFPTFLGPLARLYYFATARHFTEEEKQQRKQLFGSFSEGFRPLSSYEWAEGESSLVELPVTTMPVFRVPIHFSYLLYLACYAPWLSKLYFSLALKMCRLTKTEPSILLHPLDFLGGDDLEELRFFPAMKMPAAKKLALARHFLGTIRSQFTCVTIGEHAKLTRPRGAKKLPV